MKLKKEFIILAVVLVALIGYLIFNATNRSGQINYKLPKLKIIKTKELDRIDITKATDKISLVFDKKTDHWRIAPQDYPADKSIIDSMLKQIEELEVSELISDKKVYDRYDLNPDSKIFVVGMKGDKTLRSFDIGKVTDVANHTFIKLTDDPNVYTVKLNIRATFDKTVADLRDKMVLNINKDAIYEMNLFYKGENIVLTKKVLPKEKETDPENIEWNIAGINKKADTTQVDEILNGLNNVICDSYIPENEQVDFSNPYFKIIVKADKEYTLSALEQKTDNMHPAISSENGYQFYLIGWKMNRLMKTTEELTEKQK